ncbi:MAG: RNA polymerase-binding protein DksA [Xanthomonadales bacterium]|nr:RNA polymerase-binding protein DksA [Xanthomonadales bacterium]
MKTAASKTVAKKAAAKSPAKATRTSAAPVSKGVVATARASTAQSSEVIMPRPRKAEPGVSLPAGYRPSEREEYMSPRQLEYFRQKLLTWREDLIEESQQTMENLREEVRDVGDEAERAQRETENSLELRTRDRYRKLLAQIDKALKRIEEGEYGFCEETGEPIGLERLEVRPIARFSIDAQERWELRQKHMGE